MPTSTIGRPAWLRRLGVRLIGNGVMVCRPTLIRRFVGRSMIWTGLFLVGLRQRADANFRLAKPWE